MGSSFHFRNFELILEPHGHFHEEVGKGEPVHLVSAQFIHRLIQGRGNLAALGTDLFHETLGLLQDLFL